MQKTDGTYREGHCWRRLFLLTLFILLSSGCAGLANVGSGSEPVALPTPFSGSMTGETQFFVENGFSTGQTMFMGHLAGQLFPLTDSTGSTQGSVFIDYSTIHDLQINNGVRIFFLSVTIDDGLGSTVTTGNTQFFVVPAPEFPPTATQQDAINFSGEPDAQLMPVTGVAGGEITAGTGIFAGVQGSIDYRFMHEVILHSDGTLTILKSDFCSWVVSPN